ncbi:MAG TPA: alkaline phosphatase D family protein [Actinomycetota bacterium]|nr:alkaline phosphatase D family protein [Actinomycetota bacterium]
MGRTKTAPEQTASPDRFRFAFASCQQYEHGYYTAYRHMANEDLDLVCHLGDYIYEYGPDEYVAPGGNVRHHPAPEVMSLTDYRNRYALYKSDPDLQSAHAAFPWAFTWDDHEVENDYADEESQKGDPDGRFLRRRTNAYRACWEHMPLRSSRPRGSDLRLYQRLRFGDLVEMSVLDTRQYRSDQACARVTGEFVGGGQAVDNCPALFDEDRTMLGPRQERWVLDGLGRSKARWNVIAQQLLMAYLDEKPGSGVSFWTDGWDGYQPARPRILGYLHRRQISNPVVIGGDIHSFWATDLKADFRNEDSATVASEFVGTSITSAGVPQDVFESFLPDNPHIRFFDARLRGYVRCDIDQSRWRTDFQVVDNVRVQSSPLITLASSKWKSEGREYSRRKRPSGLSTPPSSRGGPQARR